MNLKRLTGLLTALACFNPILQAQKSFWDSPQAYLGQLRPSDTPRIFASGLLADPGTIVMDRIGFSLDGKVAVVTGGARGLGLVMAQGLMTSGAQVALVDLNGGLSSYSIRRHCLTHIAV